MAASMLISVVFLLMAVIGAILSLSVLIGKPANAVDAKTLRGILFVSSIWS
jgi:hypothetical protein